MKFEICFGLDRLLSSAFAIFDKMHGANYLKAAINLPIYQNKLKQFEIITIRSFVEVGRS